MEQDVERARVDLLEARVNLALAYARSAGGAATAAAATFVFRPGGAAAGNVYATWSALYAALDAAAPVSAQGHRSPTTIQVDDSIAPAVLPAGNYNVDAVTFVGLANFNNATGASNLTLADGVHFTASVLNVVLVSIFCAPTSAVLTVGAGQELWLFMTESGDLEVTGGTAPFLLVNNAGFADIILIQNGVLGDGVHTVANAGAGPDNLFVLAYASVVRSNALAGAGATVGFDSAGSVDTPQGAGVTINLLSPAVSVAYNPGVPGNWAGAPPTTVEQALDRIAANVGNAHPIP
jgi:hypothetical protein